MVRNLCLMMLALACGAAGIDWSGPAAADEISVVRAIRIYPAPAAAPIEDAVVLIRDGRIAAVGPRRQIKVPAGARPVQCSPRYRRGLQGDYDPTDEYIYMSRALTPAQILASLTTAPADRWQESDRRGRVAPGMQADLVVPSADPMSDVRHFADVRCTVRQGRGIYSQP